MSAAKNIFRIVANAMGLLSFLFSGLFFWVFYQRYLKWDFNELGRTYDPEEQIVYTDSGYVWIIPAIFFLLAGVGILIGWIWRREK